MIDTAYIIDTLYAYLAALSYAGRWVEVDHVLLEHEGERDPRVRLALLAATVAHRSRLVLWGLYAEATHEWLTAQGEDADAVMAGLWPEREGR